MKLEKLSTPLTCTMPGTKTVLCGQPASWRIIDTDTGHAGDETDICDSCIQMMAKIGEDAVDWLQPALADIVARSLKPAEAQPEPVVQKLTTLGQIFPGFDEWLANPEIPEEWKLPPEMRGGGR